MFKIKTLAVARRLIDLLLHQAAVIRMNSREDKFHRRVRPWIALKDSESLVGPEDLSARNFPTEAAGMTELLRLGEIRLPALQLLGQLLVLSHIHCGADNPFQDPVLDNRNSNATYVPNFAAGSHNPLGDITSRGFCKHSVD